MMKIIPAVAGVALASSILTGQVKADEAAERMIDDALPHMYHTCESLVRIAGDDEDMMVDVLGKITSVSIYMRGINIEDYDLSEEQSETLSTVFLQSVSDSCAADPSSLLAGVVDNAVMAALNP